MFHEKYEITFFGGFFFWGWEGVSPFLYGYNRCVVGIS